MDPDEPLPLLALPRLECEGGMSRALPLYREGRSVLAFVAEEWEQARPVAVAWCECEPGQSTLLVRFARELEVDDATMARLFARVRQAVAARGGRWLRWRLAAGERTMLDPIRAAVGIPVLHREGSDVVAEVGVTPTWRSR